VSVKGELLTVTIVAGAVGFLTLAARYPKRTPFDDEFDAAAAHYNLDPDMLRAIAHQETGGKFDAGALGPKNTNGTRDYGLMQINELTARRYGIDPNTLIGNAKLAIDVAARLLVSIKQELGPLFSPWTWVAAYNAGSPAIRQRGIFNMAYASSVMFHWQMYKTRRAV
jgi:Soluble lytic murein transglycosylase and related regulatory proteins (some contain LysM/invasin domains)